MLASITTTDQIAVRRSTRYFIVVGVLWSTCGILLKDIRWNVMAMVGVRSFLGVLTQLMVLTSRLKSKYDLSWTAALLLALRGIFCVPSKVHWFGAALCCLNVEMLVLCFRLQNSTNAAFFQASGVLWIGALSGLFLREHPRKEDWIAMGIAVVGMALLTGDGFQWNAWQGSLIGIVCSLTLAGGQILSKRRSMDAATGYGAVEMFILADVMAVLIGIPAVFTAGVPSAEDGWLLLALCTVSWTLPSTIYAFCVQDLPIFRAFLLTLFDPVLTPVLPWWFHGEEPSRIAVIGAGIVSAGIIYQGVSLAMSERKSGLVHPARVME